MESPEDHSDTTKCYMGRVAKGAGRGRGREAWGGKGEGEGGRVITLLHLISPS